MATAPIIHWITLSPSTRPITLEETRSLLLSKASYVASPLFLRKTSWMASISQDTLYNAEDYSPFIMSIVGVVSSKDLYMAPHGNFSTDGTAPYSQTTRTFAQAEFKFSLSPPMAYPSFMQDFKDAWNHIRIIQQPVETPPGEYCWENETPFLRPMQYDAHILTENQNVFNWSFPIFRKTGLPSRDRATWDAYRAALNPKHATHVDDVFEDFDIRHLGIIRFGGGLVRLEDYQNALEGSLVEVQFRLRNVYGQGLDAEPTRIWILDHAIREKKRLEAQRVGLADPCS